MGEILPFPHDRQHTKIPTVPHKIDSSTAAAVMPTPGAAGTGGWFTDGNPGLGVPGTVVTADWLNAHQAELLNVLAAAGITPDKTKQDQLLAAIRKLARIKLTANLTVNVATTGNDTTGDGTSGLPFATMTRAWRHLLTNYDLNGFQATIQVANGTYNTAFLASAPPVGAFNGQVIVQGNVANPASVVISTTNSYAMFFNNAGAVTVQGFKLQCTGTTGTFANAGIGILAQGTSQVQFASMNFGTCDHAHIYSTFGGYLGVAATSASSVPYTISGGAKYHCVSTDNAVLSLQGAQVTLTGTPGFSESFAFTSFAEMQANACTFSGAATGVRYQAINLSIINVAGGGASFFPGSTVGAVASNSIYS